MGLTFSVVMVFIAALVIFAVLDIAMLVTLLRPGDERNQIIVWKAPSFTLISVVGCLILESSKISPEPSPWS